MRTVQKTKKINAGSVRITALDRKALRWIGDQGKVSYDLLQILWPRLRYMEWVSDYEIKLDIQGILSYKTGGRPERVTLRWIQMWVKKMVGLGFLVYDGVVMVGEEPWVRLGTKGIRLVGREYKDLDISHYEYNHTWACNFIRLWYDLWFAEKGIDTYVIKTDRVFRHELGRDSVRPDFGLWYTQNGESVALSLNEELNEKKPEEYSKLIADYKKFKFDFHIYHCPEKKLKSIQRHFDGAKGYVFGLLEDKTLEDGTTYQF